MLIAALLVPIAVFCPGSRARAEEIQRSSVVVTMPRLALITLSGDLSGLLTLSPDGQGEAAYDAGTVASAADATVLTLTVTEAWDLMARLAGPWTCPDGYDKDESDLRIRITSNAAGTIQNGADAYVPLSGSDLSILSDAGSCSSNEVDLQTEILLDWTRDVPGSYSIIVSYTVVGHLP